MIQLQIGLKSVALDSQTELTAGEASTRWPKCDRFARDQVTDCLCHDPDDKVTSCLANDINLESTPLDAGL